MFEGNNMNEKYTRRDYLAKDRTYLANERTILSYWRTALAFLIFGAFLIKFLLSTYVIILAFVSIFFGIILFIYGTARYFKYKEKINHK
jgi:putative membrane protein